MLEFVKLIHSLMMFIQEKYFENSFEPVKLYTDLKAFVNLKWCKIIYLIYGEIIFQK
jgi:hypothetical protein